MAELKRKKLNGMDKLQYKNYKKWSAKKWAWELLRRNRKFIESCDKATNDKDQADVAKQWDLKAFKSYKENYQTGESPKFVTSVTYFANIGEETPQRLRTSMKQNDVMLRFNLTRAAAEPRFLVSQLRDAERVLKLRIKEIKGDVPKGKRSYVQTINAEDLLTVVRTLDANRNKPKSATNADILKAIYPNDANRIETVAKPVAKSAAKPVDKSVTKPNSKADASLQKKFESALNKEFGDKFRDKLTSARKVAENYLSVITSFDAKAEGKKKAKEEKKAA